jgi:ATP-dependent helicase/DNAse subunit B
MRRARAARVRIARRGATYAQAMPLELVVGPPNSGRAEEILRRFRAALDGDPILVVPTGDDVAEFERELCSDGRPSLGGSIATFRALVGEVARSLAVDVPPALTVPHREALVRAAVERARPRRLRRSAARPGFTPALDALISELQGALLSPVAFAAAVTELEDPGYESELAELYAAYIDVRDAAGRADDGLVAERAIRAVRARPEDWRGRPVFLYGFDDLSRVQLELIRALAEAAEVTTAVNYADRRALSVRARLLGQLTEELGAPLPAELPADGDHTSSRVLLHLDRSLFEPEAERVEPDDALVLLDSAGARGEAEAIGIEIARLLTGGYAPDEIAIVVRRPESAGPLLSAVLAELGLPIALEAALPLTSTCVGSSLVALCRAAMNDADVDALLAHLRCDPGLPREIVDGLERRIRRGEAQSVSTAIEGWQRPPRHLARLRDAADDRGRLAALAHSARELAEGAHRDRAPLAGRAQAGNGTVPFSALELRAGVAAAELLEELLAVGALAGCEQPGLEVALEALRSATVPAWRGPASGRIRILSPLRARVARARALFCASLQDGEFPSAGPPDPLLSEERRRQLGNPDLRRVEQPEQERYLFHACVSRPTERLYLSWQSSDEDGAALARSPFVDEVLDLIAPDSAAAEERLIRRRGPERAVPSPAEATNVRGLARAIARGGWSVDRATTLGGLGVPDAAAEAALGLFEDVPDPDRLPGPLHSPRVLAELGSRTVFSANSLEGWVQCSYRWFVNHELSPQRLEPEADPLWLGGVVHAALERLYGEAPGEDAIPRPGDVGRWRRRFAELLEEYATARAGAPLNRSRRAALDRARLQVEAFLDDEAERETEFRPDPGLLELGFGPLEDVEGTDGPTRPPLELGEISLRGRIDRIDLASDRHSAIVRDYKTGRSVPRASDFDERGTLQIQLYMLVAERILGLDPVAGLYQPLGAADPRYRKPRGIAVADDDRLDGLGLVRNDRLAPELVRDALASAEGTALEAAGRMRAGRIDRDPIGGSCPRYCTFQSICRLERVVGAVGEQNGKGGEE